MPLTDQQIRALAYLAKDCRPNGAKRWDEDGIYANVAKVRTRDLAEVVMAVIRAANDRNADTPGVIPSAGSHWSDKPIETPPARPDRPTNTERCSICSERQERCRRLWSGDHDFETDAMAARRHAELDPEALALAARAVRDGIEPTAPPKPRPTLDDLAAADPQLHERVEQVRQMIPKQPMREAETDDMEAH